MRILIICAVFIVSTMAEPPVSNRYLPPQSRGSLSTTYGTPNFGRQTAATFRRPSSTYGAPKTRPANQYLPPNNQYNAPNNQYQAPNNQYLPPTNRYSAPSNQYIPPSNQYIPPSNQYQAPSNQYQAPNNQYLPPGSQYNALSNQYQTPSNQYSAPRNQYLPPNAGIQVPPSQEYGTPVLRGNQGSGNEYNQQSRQYLPPGGRYEDGSNGEPANYNFEYMVKDEYSGNDFGHRESRQGDRAEGLYYVLLPDGRKQTVEYEADENGYKPRISYEDTGVRTDGRNNQGYDSNASGPY